MDPRKRVEIISAFGAVLEKGKSLVGRESDLPFPKELIRLAMAEELVNPTFCLSGYSLPETLGVMEASFIMLESFVSDEEHLQVQRYELVLQSAQQLKDSNDKTSVLEVVKALAEVDNAAIQVLNRVNKLTEARSQQLAQIRALRSKG